MSTKIFLQIDGTRPFWSVSACEQGHKGAAGGGQPSAGGQSSRRESRNRPRSRVTFVAVVKSNPSSRLNEPGPSN